MSRTCKSWQPRQSDWDAAHIFRDLRPEQLALDEESLASLQAYFWFDLCAEWDSRHLHQVLMERSELWSPEFLAFEAAWYKDELNHAEGFLRLFASLYQLDTEDLRQKLQARRPNFQEVEAFLTDECQVLVLFAYDELATMRAYRIDIDLYARFQSAEMNSFIRYLMRDETYHHKNAFDLVVLNHGSRLADIDAMIDGFLDFDESEESRYQGTFLFDHEWAHVRPDFFAETARILKAGFKRARCRVL